MHDEGIGRCGQHQRHQRLSPGNEDREISRDVVFKMKAEAKLPRNGRTSISNNRPEASSVIPNPAPQ